MTNLPTRDHVDNHQLEFRTDMDGADGEIYCDHIGCRGRMQAILPFARFSIAELSYSVGLHLYLAVGDTDTHTTPHDTPTGPATP